MSDFASRSIDSGEGGEIYVGLGANLGDREAMLERALACLDADDDIEVLAVSKYRCTAPWGVHDQPEFLNAVAEISTRLAPAALVHRLLDIERELGRERSAATRWAARTIDLDLLLYRDLVVDEEGCRVPHPHLFEREFALRPLLDIAPDVVIPHRGSASSCLERIETDAIERADERLPA